MSREPIPLHAAPGPTGTIEAIRPTARRSLVRLQFADGSQSVARSSLLQGLGLAEGVAVFPSVRRTLQEHERELANAAAMRLAARAERTADEIERGLLDQGYSRGAVDEAVANLERINGVSDERAAASHVATRTGRRARSARLLRQELRQRGVGDETATTAVEGIDDDSNALDLARGLLRQRHYADFDSYFRRTSGFLLRRGYRHGVALKAAQTAWAELESSAE
jgi:SOS response regulatory protein OraA/RecX